MDLEMFPWGGWSDGYLTPPPPRSAHVVYYNVLQETNSRSKIRLTSMKDNSWDFYQRSTV